MTAEDQGAEGVAPATGISRNAYLFLAAFILLGVATAWAPSRWPVAFLFVVVGWILALAIHEFGHAWVAWKAGDHTVAAKGYLSLDPLKYTDLGASLVIPLIALALGGIGFPGGAVYLRPDLMRSPLWRSAASLAGPAGTLLALLVLAGLLRLMAASGLDSGPLAAALAFLAFLQATALLLNLLPIPGLDGYGVLRPFLPKAARRAMIAFERVGLFLLIGVIFLAPGVSQQLFVAAVDVTRLLGVPTELVRDGYAAFAFWR